MHREICLEKKLSKYLFTKDIKITKRNKSKSPSSISADDIENLKFDKKLDLFGDDDHSLFFDKDHFLLESKLKILDNPFLSNIKKNHHIAMKWRKEEIGNNYMKLRSKIIINDNISDLIENNIFNEINEGNLNLFNDALINSDILSNDEILNPEIKNNKVNEKKEETQKNISINLLGDLTDKEKIVIDALNSLDKMNNNDKTFVWISIEDFDIDKYYFDEIYDIDKKKIDPLEYEQKKVIYAIINERIKTYYNYYKINKSYKIKETDIEKNELKTCIKHIFNFETNYDYLLFSGFKSIVINLYVLVITWLANSHFKVYLMSFKNDNNYLDIFIELMEKYNTIKDICPFLEKDFKEIIEDYQQKKNIKFCLCELLTDLYWDYVFKIHKINNMFTSCYKLDNTKKNVIFEEAKHAMKSIIDILIVNDTSYKKYFGEELKLPYMNKENVFLMDLINKSKKTVNPFEIKNPFIIQKDKNLETEKNNNDKKINNNNNNNEKETVKEKKNEENKNTENFTLDEVYKYIVGDSKNENKKHKKKNKNRKKKKKNKNEEIKITEEVDPVVEEFIQYFIEYQQDYVPQTKIKPVISEEWIKSIS